jgi:large subunit ribosomal protein L24
MKKIEEPKSNRSKKIRKGDTVIAIAGNNRGKTGTVLSCSGEKVLVQGLNVRKKHVKPSQANQRGGIVEIEKPIHVSNLKVCAEGNTPVKLKVRENKKGERELVYANKDKDVLYRSLKKS